MLSKEEKQRRKTEWQRKRYAEDPVFRARKNALTKISHQKHKQKRLENQKAWREKNKELVSKWHRRKHLRIKYGLSVEQFRELVASARGKCPVCLRPFSKESNIIVDHCHTTNLVRGIICRNCNLAEGNLGSPEAALRLYKYMLKNELFYQGGN